MTSLLAAFRRWLRSPIGIAVNALGVTQIVGWGTTYYALAVLAPAIAADTGWSAALIFGGLTLGLLVSGVISTTAGGLADRLGARRLMTLGALVNMAGLAALSQAPSESAYLASWAVLGIGMRLTLYDAAFAALVQVDAAKGRPAISYLTLWGGFASTAFWPIGHVLAESIGWRETCLVFAALNLLVCAPLHWIALASPKGEARREPGRGPNRAPMPSADDPSGGETAAPPQPAPAPLAESAIGDPDPGYLVGRERLIAMALFSLATSAYAFIFGAASAHLVALIEANGVAAATAVSIAALKGVAQVGGRLWDIVFARGWRPTALARVPVWLMALAFVILLSLTGGVGSALVFTLCFGAANGLITIVRGALPLALFGPDGYGRILGLLATPFLIINAAAPLLFALVVERGGYEAGAWTLFGFAALSLLAMETLVAWHGRRAQPAE